MLFRELLFVFAICLYELEVEYLIDSYFGKVFYYRAVENGQRF